MVSQASWALVLVVTLGTASAAEVEVRRRSKQVWDVSRQTVRDGGGLNWRAVASDKKQREQRLVNMRGLVLDLLKDFDANDFDDETFKQMAHCFVTEESGKGADEKKWEGLVKALIGVAREAFKAETGMIWKPEPVVETPLADPEITVFTGELLGINDPP